MNLRIRPQAEVDLLAIASLIRARRPASARRFLVNTADAFDLLARSPQMGARGIVKHHPDIRSFSIRRFPNHVILYIALPDGADIVRVVNGRRDLKSLFNDDDSA